MSKAFTIIELLVVIGIIALMTIVVFANYQAGDESLALQRSTHKLSQDLRRAQNLAISAKEFSEQTPEGYGIYFNLNEPKKYILFADLNGDRVYSGQNEKVEEIVLETEITALEPVSDSSLTVVFEPPEPTVYFSPDLDTASITIGPESDVEINKAGLVNVVSTMVAGRPCSQDSECISGHCYRDSDGDSYAAASGEKNCKTAASLGIDCYDANADAYPGQTLYFAANRGDGSYDYDCDGQQTRVINCLSTFFRDGCFTSARSGSSGWANSIPACGATGTTRQCSVFRDSAACAGYGSSGPWACGFGCPSVEWPILSWQIRDEVGATQLCR